MLIVLYLPFSLLPWVSLWAGEGAGRLLEPWVLVYEQPGEVVLQHLRVNDVAVAEQEVVAV